LYDLLPRDEDRSADTLLTRFLEYTGDRRLTLYPAQEAAILELFEGRNVILNTPTGSGKSLVAAALHFHGLSNGRRSIYTCPIKALVNEKWMALCREFGPDNVGLSTGDASVNRDAPILCCTAEVLANIALREGAEARVHDVVMDEFHWYADRDRGVAWQVPLLTLPQARFLLMSATLGDTAFFEEELTHLNGRETVTVKSQERPVPLEFSYAETTLAETVEKLIQDGKAPVYIVHFTQAEAAQGAQDFTSINVCSRDEKAAIATSLEGFKFNSPYGPDIKRWLRHGIGLHHAGLLPKYRVLVEQLAQRGLLKIICGTDTLGVGVNVPIRTVLFTRLCKFDGQKVGILGARDFHQIAGRAGRKGFDDRGWVVVQAPEHVIENLKLERKAGRDGRKFQRRQAPDRNWVNWDRKTFDRIVAAPPERLTSRFQVSHGLLLNVLSRPGDGCAAMRDLIRRSHESPNQKKAHARRAWLLFRSLLERGIVELVNRERLADAFKDGRKVRVNIELQEDFSMDQTLSLYLLETISLLDPEAPDYALDVLTLVESILENPDLILRKQLDRLKAARIAEWKAEGMDYFERMEELEKLEYPKPRREFIYSTFNAFADKHPWVGQENIRPKSIAREMFEEFRSFADYIRLYDLQRSEGLLLRHLNSACKVLSQTVPDPARTAAVREIEVYLRTMIREVDSSLLEEWERMRDPHYVPRSAASPRQTGTEPEAPPDSTRNTQAFTAAIRTRIFAFIRAIANQDLESALDELRKADSGGSIPAGSAPTPGLVESTDETRPPWNVERLRSVLDDYHKEHERLRLDPEARNLRHTHVRSNNEQRKWQIEQVLVDPEERNDWVAAWEVDMAASRIAGEPVLRLTRIGPVGPA
jgi:superfamily II RNA helicase